MQSDQWHPSDIEGAGGDNTQAEPSAKPTRRTAAAAVETAGEPVVAEAPRKAATAGIMTLDRDSASKSSAQEAAQAEAALANDVQTRFTETADRVKSQLAKWKAGNDGEADLTVSLHDLRRVLARIEIELASSHAGDALHKPIPIPLHRAHKGL